MRRRLDERRLSELLIASADQFRDFEDRLGRLSAEAPVTVLGFAEFNSYAERAEDIAFLDLEDVPGLFEVKLPREGLARLPAEGLWLPAKQDLRAAVARARLAGQAGP